MSRLFVFFFISMSVAPTAFAAVPAGRLEEIRGQVLKLQAGLLDTLRSTGEVKSSIKKIQTLMKLQKEERELGQKRIAELETTIDELQVRRGVLRERILVHQRQIRIGLVDIGRSLRLAPLSTRIPESEKTEAPRRKLVANLVDRGLREIESYKADLADADNLETRINEENQHLVYLLQDLKEQEGVLELNRQLQLDLLQRKHQERLSQLDRYRDLKNSESQVQRLIGDFNARKELEKAVEQERIVAKEMRQGPFAKRRGMLPLPVAGNIISNFGRVFDAKSNLHVFRKGIEIAAGARQEVHAISAGRIAYSGELPNYGRVAIVDHGDHFYSLCANLGSLSRKMGEAVAAGETIGVSDDAGAPVYFEIRARNIAVNPLQWVSN